MRSRIPLRNFGKGAYFVNCRGLFFNLSARQLFGVACFLCCRKPAELSHYPSP